MKRLKLFIYFLFLFSVSCNNDKTEVKVNPVTTNDNKTELFKSKVIIILSEKLNEDGNIIKIQDFVDDGLTYIPVFSSKEKFAASTKGTDLREQIIEIDGLLLLSMLTGSETLRIDPGLDDEKTYKASDLISKYKREIENFKTDMAKGKK